MAGGSITGVVGRIEGSYFVAAAINGYTVTRSETNDWSLRATVVQADAFKLTQRPLVFVAPTNQGAMRWPITVIEQGPSELRAKLGPPLP